MDRAPTASSRCVIFVAPIIGAVTGSFCNSQASARQVQRALDYDPQPPFGRLNYDDMGVTLRLLRMAASLTAPLGTARPKRLTRHERAGGVPAS